MFEEPDHNLPTLILSQFLNKLKKYWSLRLGIQVFVFILGLSLSSFGLLYLLSDDSKSVTTSESANEQGSPQVCTKSSEFGRLSVDIGGAVASPGVYELPVNSRINDLINIAGGFTDSVDKYHINKVLNLSQRLNDGEKFYIPTFEESLEVVEKQLGSSSSKNSQTSFSISEVSKNENPGSLLNSSTVISINFALESELVSLTGIGEKRAEDIITNRPYDSVSQLVEKKVLTTSIFEKIKNDISL